MICDDEKLFLHWIARDYFAGQGQIVDMGALAGASTYSLASGLALNPRIDQSRRWIHSYDFWRFLPNFDIFFPGQTFSRRQDIFPAFQRNLGDKMRYVNPHQGNIRKYRWDGGPIEILFIDAAKTVDVWWHIWREYFPHAIPGRTLVLHQDYICESCHWLAMTMTRFSDYFEFVDSPEGGTVCFLLKKALPQEAFRNNFLASLSVPEGRRLLQEAALPISNWQRLYVRLAEANYLASHRRYREARDLVASVQTSPDYDESVNYGVNYVLRRAHPPLQRLWNRAANKLSRWLRGRAPRAAYTERAQR
jgi:hypothetical protein